MAEPIQSNTESHLINMLFEDGLAEDMPKIAQLLLNFAVGAGRILSSFSLKLA